MHNHYNIESDKLLPRATGITIGHSLKLSKQRFNLDVWKRFYSNRVNNHWNCLPEEIANAPSINSFKYQIDNYYKDKIFSTDPSVFL